MTTLGASNKLCSLFKVIPSLQEMVNDYPKVLWFDNEQRSLAKSDFREPEVPVTFLFVLIKGFVGFFRRFHLLLVVELLNFLLQTVALVVELLQEVQGLKQQTGITDQTLISPIFSQP